MKEQPRQDPLWRHCLSLMEPEHGKFYKLEFFEKELSVNRDSKEFQFSMMNIGEALKYEFGEMLILTSAGLKGTGYRILGRDELPAYQEKETRKSFKSMRNVINAGARTDTSLMSESAKSKLLAQSEKASLRYLLMSRSSKVAKFLHDNNSDKLLE